MASDGWVVAADGQMTQAGAKLSHGKVSMVQRLDRPGSVGSCVVCGAGTPGYLRHCSAGILRVFSQNPSSTGETLRVQFENEFARFYRKHVIPFGRFPFDQRPGIEIIVATIRDGQSNLWSSAESAIVTATPYETVGSGGVFAKALLEMLFGVPLLNAKQTAMLAAYVLALTKEFDSYCGKYTDIVYTLNGRARMLPRPTTSKIEAVAKRYANQVGAAAFRSALGIGSVAGYIARHRKAFQRAMDDLSI